MATYKDNCVPNMFIETKIIYTFCYWLQYCTVQFQVAHHMTPQMPDIDAHDDDDDDIDCKFTSFINN